VDGGHTSVQAASRFTYINLSKGLDEVNFQIAKQALLVFLHIFLIAFAGLWMALIKGNLW